jgi:flagellar hook assembly protein FlgD
MAGTTSISGDLSKTNLPNKVQKEREDLEKEKKNFLTFFIESLKGQDPTSPMDHSQLTNTILSFQNTSNLMDIKGILHTNLDK